MRLRLTASLPWSGCPADNLGLEEAVMVPSRDFPAGGSHLFEVAGRVSTRRSLSELDAIVSTASLVAAAWAA